MIELKDYQERAITKLKDQVNELLNRDSILVSIINIKMTEPKIKRKCIWCNKEFIGIKNTCSKKCLSELRSFNIKGNKNPMYNSHRYGSLNPNWRNGISFEEYNSEFNKQLKQLIKNRDNNICQMCGKHNNKLVNKNNVIYGL